MNGQNPRATVPPSVALICSATNPSPGHKSIKTTQRYLGTCTQLRREAVNRLNFAEVKAEGASGG